MRLATSPGTHGWLHLLRVSVAHLTQVTENTTGKRASAEIVEAKNYSPFEVDHDGRLCSYFHGGT